MSKLKFIVGSMSVIKLEAVRMAAEQLGLSVDVRGIEAASGELSQPLALRTLHGAITRAHEASMEPAGWDVAIGIEIGISLEQDRFVDLAYIAVLLPDGSGAHVRSEAVPVPTDLAHVVLACKQRQTIGQLEAARSGCDHTDPHRVWTNGRTDRKTILVAAVREVLKRVMHAQGGFK